MILLFITGALLVFYYYNVNKYIDFQTLKDDQNRFLSYIASLFLFGIGLFALQTASQRPIAVIEAVAFSLGFAYPLWESDVWERVYWLEAVVSCFEYPGFEETSLTQEEWIDLSFDQKQEIWRVLNDADKEVNS